MTVTVTGYVEARDALRHRDLRQALYDEGASLMTGVIVNLHGEEHIARRRLENRLFRRDTFAWYERERIPAIIAEVLATSVTDGRADLPPLARRTMMTLSIDVAGVDRPEGDLEELFAVMEAMARAATVAHATGDKAAIIAAGDEALACFEADIFEPSLARRRALVERWEQGRLAVDELPRDVLTTLLVNHDRLDLPPETVLREVAYYPWVGSHSTSNQFVHAMHHLFTWIADHPGDRDRLRSDGALRQRFVHESMRLHPASPVAVRIATTDITLASTGRQIQAGETVVISIDDANRDTGAVGPEPGRFDPYRRTGNDVPAWGLSFGSGTHACLGQALAGGLAPEEVVDHHLLGAVAVLAGTMLDRGARPDPADPPSLDPTTTRSVWGRYPVLLD